MIQQSPKNENSLLCYDVIITRQNLKFTNLMIFRVISILNVRQTYFENLSPL